MLEMPHVGGNLGAKIDILSTHYVRIVWTVVVKRVVFVQLFGGRTVSDRSHWSDCLCMGVRASMLHTA